MQRLKLFHSFSNSNIESDDIESRGSLSWRYTAPSAGQDRYFSIHKTGKRCQNEYYAIKVFFFNKPVDLINTVNYL